MKSTTQSASKITNQEQSTHGLNNHQSNTQVNRQQIVPNDVFKSPTEVDEEKFEFSKQRNTSN